MNEFTTALVCIGTMFLVPYLRTLYFRNETILPKTDNTKTPHLPYFDFLRGLAIVAVIIIHVIYFYQTVIPEHLSNELKSLNNLLRFAIPFFFITAGILLTPFSYTRNKYKAFFKKKVWKLIPAYLLCCLIISVFYKLPVNQTLWLSFNGRITPPYYFIVVLFQLYLIYPLLLKYRRASWFLPLSFAFTIVCYVSPPMWIILGVPFFGRYLFFFTFGIKLREFFLNKKIEQKELPYWAALIILYTGLALTLWGIYYNVRLIYGIALFSLLMILQPSLERFNKVLSPIAFLGKNSLWIYLTHFAVVKSVFFLISPTNASALPFLLITMISLPLCIGVAICFKHFSQKLTSLVE